MIDTAGASDPVVKEQETRATLRELFLKAVGELSGNFIISSL